MPSIFNHENACWGVKKSFSNLLYCDYNDDLTTRKLDRVIGDVPNTTNSMKYSVSSNGYYGYQPHSNFKNNVEPSDSIPMDIDINNIPASQLAPNQNPQDSKSFDFSSKPRLQSFSRKRQMSGDLIESNKKMRPQDGDGVGSRLCLLRGQLSREGEGETTAELLRLTHGCEVYLYERICDY